MSRRVVLLLNNAFIADSRSWKIARSLADRGDEVTVVARAGEGLPARQETDGFTVLRLSQPRPLPWLPTPGLPPPGTAPAVPAAEQPATPEDPARGLVGSIRRRLRESAGRAAQAVRYLLLARAWAAEVAGHVPTADVWQAEGLVTLPVALALRRRGGGAVVYDSRDLHPESGRFARLPRPWRRLLADRERAWARAADAIVTVNRPYARELERSFGRMPAIVFNGPRAWQRPDPPEPRFHDRLGLPPATRVVLVLGAVVAHRGIEQACMAIGEVPDAVLVVVGRGEARPRIEAEARALPHGDRIHFLDQVPPAELLPWTAAADVAVMPIQPSTLNHRLTTPTRLFDALGAGVPVVASDLPGMAEIVAETGCGLVCDPTSPADIARAIRDVLDGPPDRRAAFRAAGLAAARGAYAWDRQIDRLMEVYASVAGGGPTPPAARA